MKKTIKLKYAILPIVSIFLLSSVLIYSCTKSPSSVSLTTVAEDKQFITSSFNSTSACINDIVKGNGAQSLINFIKLSNGTTSNDDWINKMSDALDSIFPQSTKQDGTFDFAAYTGTYTWNHKTQTFSRKQSNTISIEFPSDSTLSNNDIIATFQSYTEKKYQVNSQDNYFPTSAVINITKNGSKIAGVNYSGTFSTGDFPTPQDISFSINLAPYDYRIKVTQINSTQFQFTANLGCASVLNATLTFNNSDYKNFNAKTYLDNIIFSYTKDNFIIKGNWDAKTFNGLNNPNTKDINTTLNLTVNNGSSKIGDLKFVDVAGGGRELFVVYKDGTTANTSIDYNPFLTNVKNIFRPYFGNGVDDWF